MEDSVLRLKGAGGIKGEKLVEQGIRTVRDLKDKSDANLLTIASATAGIPFNKLIEWRNTPAHPNSCPHQVLDHRKANNPYESRFGKLWRQEIKHTVFMQQYVCITDLVQHIHDQS